MADYNGYLSEENTMIADIYNSIQGTMYLSNTIFGYATPPLITYQGIISNDIYGILTTTFYNGFLDSAQTVEKIVYRTVGSPRRRPLESSWTHSKDAEAFIIDEVDGDVDE